MLVKRVLTGISITFLLIIPIIILSTSIYAIQETSMSLQGRATNSDGTVVTLGTLLVNVSSQNDCSAGLLWTQSYPNSINDGYFAITLGNDSGNPLLLDFNEIYYLCTHINGELVSGPNPFRGGQGMVDVGDINTTSDYEFNDVNVTGSLQVGTSITDRIYMFFQKTYGLLNNWLRIEGNVLIQGNLTVNGTVSGTAGAISGGGAGGTFTNKTVTTYSGSLSAGGFTGYLAGHYVCNATFDGTHMCSYSEMAATIATQNLSNIPDWSGDIWITTGAAKYSPAPVPVNDCNGFTHGAAGSYLGNWWTASRTDGGKGKTGHCGNVFPLACCK